MLRLVLAFALLGCGYHRSYHPPPIAGEHRALRSAGDLQLAFELRYVGANDGAPMLTLWLRNAGVEPAPLNLDRMRIRGYAPTGVRALYLVDPRGELEPLHVDAGASGHEKIRIADDGYRASRLTKVCLEIGAMVAAPIPPVCFVPGTDAVWEESK